MIKNPKILIFSCNFSNKAIYDKHFIFSKCRFRILSECTSVDYIDQEWTIKVLEYLFERIYIGQNNVFFIFIFYNMSVLHSFFNALKI